MRLDTEFSPPARLLNLNPSGEASTACFALASRPDGRILAAGYETIDDGSNLLLMGLNADGTTDTGFGQGGRIVPDIGRNASAYALALLPRGKILMAGSSRNSNDADALVLRLLADGHPDPGFGANGVVRLGERGVADHALALSETKDGGTLVAGWHQGAGHPDLRLWALTETGRPDRHFGRGGMFTYDAGGEDVANAVRVEANGRILVAGRSHEGRDLDAVLLRLTPDGKLDATFGRNGVVRFDTGSDEALFALEILPDGRVLAAGERQGADGPRPMLLVYDTQDRISSVDLGPRLHGRFLALTRFGDHGLLLVGELGWQDSQGLQILELTDTGSGWSIVGPPLGITEEGHPLPFLATAISPTADGKAVVTGWSGRGGDTACDILRLRP